MEKELAKLKDDRKIHDRLIDNLNHASSVDGVFIWIWTRRGCHIPVWELQIFCLPMVIYDIYCVVGSYKSNIIPLPCPRTGVRS